MKHSNKNTWYIHKLKLKDHICQLVVSNNRRASDKNKMKNLNKNLDFFKKYVKLSGYTAHNFYRQFQHRNARRCSGGLMLYYWGSLKDGISIVKNQYDTIIWITFDAVFFKLDTDVYI